MSSFREDLEQSALYPLLEQRLRINTEVAHQTMQAEGAPAEIAELLDVAVGAPVMLVVRLARDVDNRPVEHSGTYFRADAMRFSIALYRNRAPDLALPFSFEQQAGGRARTAEVTGRSAPSRHAARRRPPARSAPRRGRTPC